jgi:hypothetical protein
MFIEKPFRLSFFTLPFFCLFVSISNAQTIEWKWMGAPSITQNNVYTLISKMDVLENGSILFMADGLYRSTNRLTSWMHISASANDYAIGPNNELYTATDDGCYSSSNLGSSWKSMNDELPTTQFRNIKLTPNGVLVTCSDVDAVYRSTNFGETWDHVATNIPFGEGNMTLNCTKRGSLVLGYDSKGWRSTDDGVTWKPAPTTEPILFTAIDEDLLMYGFEGGISISTDDGHTYKKQMIPGYSAYTFCRPVEDSHGAILSGGMKYPNAGVIVRSKDRGITWQKMGGCGEVTCMGVAPDDYLYQGTYRSGLSRSLKALSAPGNPPINSFYVHSALSGGEEALEYAVPARGQIQINLFNLLGVKVQTLFDGVCEGGAHILSIDLASLPRGEYFAALRKGQSQTVCKVINQ